MKKTRDLLNFHAFGTDPGKGMSQDYNRPLIIPTFSDSFSAIMGGDASNASMEVMKHNYTTHFPQSVIRESYDIFLTIFNFIQLVIGENIAAVKI